MIDDAQRVPLARWIGRVFGAKARALGWVTRPGDPDPVRVLREHVLPLVAIHGRDAKLAAEGRSLAERWLSQPTSVDADTAAGALRVLAYSGDATLVNKLLDLARRSPQDHDAAIRGLTLIGTRDGVRATLDALRDGRLSPRELRAFGYRAKDTPAAGETFRYLTEHYDEVLARLPPFAGTGLLSSGEGLCTEDDARAYATFFQERAPKLLGGPRKFAQMRERVDACVKVRSIQAPLIATYLGRPR
jgi:alanyl aminopeptidase